MQVGFELPKQDLNPQHLHWKVRSQSLDCQGSPYNFKLMMLSQISKYVNYMIIWLTIIWCLVFM